ARNEPARKRRTTGQYFHSARRKTPLVMRVAVEAKPVGPGSRPTHHQPSNSYPPVSRQFGDHGATQFTPAWVRKIGMYCDPPLPAGPPGSAVSRFAPPSTGI